MLWCLQFLPGFSGFMTTRNQRLVDDGGENSSWKSLFGRVRFLWNHLPDHLRFPMSFNHMKIECLLNQSYLTGEAPTEESSRSGTYARAFIDETAKLEYGEQLHAALDPACRFGKIYLSTPNGPANLFARIKKSRPQGWEFEEIDWTEDPDKTVGLVQTVTDEDQERFGPVVSPWLRERGASLSNDQLAEEYLRSYTKSVRGLVFKEFSILVHSRDFIPYDPDLPVIVGVDYGASGFGAAVVGQPVGQWMLNIIADYEVQGAGGVKVHAKNIWDVIQRLGFGQEPRHVELIGGPDTNITQTSSGQTVAGYYKEFGFLNIRQCKLRGEGSVKRRINVGCVALGQRRVRISTSCQNLIGRFPEYRWPIEKATQVIRDLIKPVHNDASHIMDAFGYLVAEVFPEENAGVPMGYEDLGQPLLSPQKWDRDVPHALVTGDAWQRTVVGPKRKEW